MDRADQARLTRLQSLWGCAAGSGVLDCQPGTARRNGARPATAVNGDGPLRFL